MILIDTDIVVDLVRDRAPAMAWLIAQPANELAICGFTQLELFQGCQNKEDLSKVDTILRNFAVVWPSPETCKRAAELLRTYRLSHSLGLIDAIIAETAIAAGSILYTFNQKHFACIEPLTTARPYVR